MRRGFTRVLVVAVVVGLGQAAVVDGVGAQEQEAPRNLQFFPPDTPRDSLIQIMRGFSFALGVRCQFCHVGGDGVSFDGVDFASDDDPDKRKARFMLRMVETLNQSMLPLMPDRDEPASEMSCKSCHRGNAKPELLTDVLRRTLDSEGGEAAAERYRTLRDRVGLSGMYDFGEWETNVLAERLAREGRNADAIAIYRLNAEFYPNSASIWMSLGGLYEEEVDRAMAISAYERVLELLPDNEAVQARLAALRGG